MPEAEAAAEAALSIDPDLAEAYCSRASVRALYHWDWQGAGRDFERARRLAPNYATGHQWFAVHYLAILGRFEEARNELALALDLDPTSLVIQCSQGLGANLAGDPSTAIRYLNDVLLIDERFSLAHFFRGHTYLSEGQLDLAVGSFREAHKWSSESVEATAALGHTLALVGEHQEARRMLEELTARARKRYTSPYRLAQIHVGLGEVDQAFRQLELAFDLRAGDLPWLGVHSFFDSIRDDPRYPPLLDRLGLDSSQ